MALQDKNKIAQQTFSTVYSLDDKEAKLPTGSATFCSALPIFLEYTLLYCVSDNDTIVFS